MYDLLEIVGELSCVLVFYVTDTVNYYYYFVIVVVNLSLTLIYLNKSNIAKLGTNTYNIQYDYCDILGNHFAAHTMQARRGYHLTRVYPKMKIKTKSCS